MKPDLKRIEAALQQMDVHTVERSGESRTAEMNGLLPFDSADYDRAIAAPGSMSFAPHPPPNSSWNLPVNSSLAISLLQEIQTTVSGWQTHLQTLTQQIKAIYSEGPIVDGWMEAEENGDSYRLCGLNEDGHPWFRHCPVEQVPDVSLAIARYQRFQTLVSRKHTLESRLAQLTEALIELQVQVLNPEP
jgi:hypothetical protein